VIARQRLPAPTQSGRLPAQQRHAEQPVHSQPKIVTRPAITYMALVAETHRDKVERLAQEAFQETTGYLERRGITPSGPGFLNYVRITPEGQITLEMGVPVPPGTQGNFQRPIGELPGGDYASLVHFGSHDGLPKAHADLLDWVKRKQFRVDVDGDASDGYWAARLEIYLKDARNEPNRYDWATEVAYKLL
jgi:effector-binding domain-containing protein